MLPELSAIDLLIRARPAAYGARDAELTSDLEQWTHLLS